MAFAHPLRRYQALALDAFEARRAEKRERCYVVMPPGSGKTVVGLEIARRLGRKTIVFGPNTAIQSQWVRQWNDFAPPKPAGTETSLTADVTVLTYQALCTLDHGLDELPGVDPDADDLDADEPDDVAEPDDAADPSASTPAASPIAARRRHTDDLADRRRRRKLIANGGDRAALLGLLHPNGRKLIERMKAEPEITLVLDECHHLLEMWGYLVQAVVDELDGKVFVVGLTATPPGEMGAREAALYSRLFGRADFEVVTPAVVKEGDLAPYQELAYLTEPLPTELAYMRSQSQRFDDLIADLMSPTFASRPFLDWLHQRVIERGSHSGAQVSWARFELDEPELVTAVLRLFLAKGFKLPDGARIGERHRQPPTTDDWVAMIGDYCDGFLERSAAPGDEAAWERIRRALPAVGYILTRQGIRAYVSPADRVLALSASKGAAAQQILDLEARQLGAELRALILCDFERAGVELLAELRSVLDAQAGSASLIVQMLVADAATRALDPILLTGRTVACSRATATRLIAWCREQVPEIADALGAMPLGTAAAAGSGAVPAAGSGDWGDVVLIAPDTRWWQPRNYVPLITRFFEEGRSRCLVGTRGLLGEGWDAHTVNVLIDLTAASTATSVHQMRGRSLRLNATLPHKVADNWDVVCVAPDEAKGLSDYWRFVRKHHAYYALNASGEIECGVSHVDPVLTPFGPPPVAEAAALNARTLARVELREQAYAEWGVGTAYRNVETETIRLHFNRSLGLPGVPLGGGRRAGRGADKRRPGDGPTIKQVLKLGFAAFVAVAFFLGLGEDLGLDLSSVLSFFGIGALALAAIFLVVKAVRFVPAARTASGILKSEPSGSLERIAAAVVEGLAATDGVDRTLGSAAVRIVVQPDGYYRCYLDGATREDSRAFTEALDQVLAPLESPRYIIPRRVVDPPLTRRRAIAFVIRNGLGMPGGRLIYHAVPDFLAANEKRVAAFEQAWDREVRGGGALFYRDPKAVGILAVEQGENPFATESQMRTLWS
ncbi:MAG TPA: DEAD/DEAH box helicase family protein [Candidatus Limnocylindrales bacterium]